MGGGSAAASGRMAQKNPAQWPGNSYGVGDQLVSISHSVLSIIQWHLMQVIAHHAK